MKILLPFLMLLLLALVLPPALVLALGLSGALGIAIMLAKLHRETVPALLTIHGS